jgi:AcrR family transcriptional regulator
MARQERAVRTREAALAAAGEVFAARGFAGTNLSDVYGSVGVTKGGLYGHFASKEDLAAAVVALEEERAAQVSAEVLSRGATPLETLVDLSYRWTREIQDNPVVRGGIWLIVERGRYEPAGASPYQSWESLAETLLRQAQAQGVLRADLDCAKLAKTVTAAFTGLQLVSQIFSNHRDLPDRLDAFWDVTLRGTLAEGVAPPAQRRPAG